MTRPAERAGWSRTDYTMALAQLALAQSGPLFESDRLKSAGRLDEARGVYRRLCDVLGQQLALSEEFNAEHDPPHMELAPIVGALVNAQLMLADVEETLGAREAAERLRAQAAELAARYLPPADVAQRKRQLAAVRESQSRYHEAMTLLTEARDELERRGDVLGSAHVTTQLAETLEWLGDRARASREAARAAAQLEPLLPPAAAGPSLGDMLSALLAGDLQGAQQRAEVLKVWTQLVQIDARTSREAGELERAAALFRKVRPRVPAVAVPAIDFQLARIEIQSGRPAQGLAALAALEPAFTGLLRPKLGVLLSWRAQGLLAQGDLLGALAAATPAVAELAQYADHDSLWRAQWVRARVLLAQDRAAEGRAELAAAVATITGLRRGSLGFRLDSTYLADKLPVIETAIALAARADDAVEACRLIELVKARGLTAILSLPRGGDGGAGTPQDEVDAISRELDRLEYAAGTGAEAAGIESRKQELLERRAALLERIRIVDPRWRALSEPPAFDPAALGARLGQQGRAALTLYLRADQMIAVLVDGGGCAVDVRALPAATRAALDAYRQSLARKPADPAAQGGLELDALVPAPLVERALRAEAVVIAPHGFLHLLPWALLRWQGKRLCEHRPSSLVPNLSCLALVPPGAGEVPRIGLIGDPAYTAPHLRRLDMAGEELREIFETYGAARVLDGHIVEGPDATEAAFRAMACHADAGGATLHVASHGDFVAEEPLYSGLLLVDGKVDAAEIARLPLRYHEVVLSACSTGYRATAVDGVPLTGDDVVGLVGAFLEAGARNVVVSITRANDSASYAFMTAYHGFRAAGSPPVRAVQETQLAMLDASTYPAALWAGFVVYGC